MEDVLFFETPPFFRKWLEKNHLQKKEQWVGFYKKATGKESITWSESVDQALCFGWIDGLRRSIDDQSYKIRFTPRKKNSHWSAVNLKKMKELIKNGEMTQAGLAIYKMRNPENEKKASFEQKRVELPPEYLKKVEENEKALEFFRNLAPSYKKASIHWVISAKREETRLKRLNTFIDCSARGEKIPMLIWSKKK